MNGVIAAILLTAMGGPPQETATYPVEEGAWVELLLGSAAAEVVVGESGRVGVGISGDTARFAVNAGPRRVQLIERDHVPDSARVRISVPEGTQLVIRVRTGRVSVSGPVGGLEAWGRGELLRIDGARGPITVHAGGEAVVEVLNSVGVLSADATAGSIHVEGHQGSVDVESVGGDITVLDVDSDQIEASTTNGDVRFQGRFRGSGSYVLSSVNGDVQAEIGLENAGLVTVGTVQGRLESEFEAVESYQPGERGIFQLGPGTARLELITFRGSIRLLPLP